MLDPSIIYCPKCGAARRGGGGSTGPVWSNKVSYRGGNQGEWLAETCHHCGFLMDFPCKDAKADPGESR